MIEKIDENTVSEITEKIKIYTKERLKKLREIYKKKLQKINAMLDLLK